MRIGLASNSPRFLVDDALATAGLAGAFETIVTSDDVEHAKPAPDIYLLACERLGVDPSEAVALEDSASGVTAAKAAGLACIAVPSSPRPTSQPRIASSTRSRSCSSSRRRGNAYPLGMCRSIKTLRTGPVPASDDEISAAALQYVRKVSGYRKPSTANEHAFEAAVDGGRGSFEAAARGRGH